MSFSHGMTGVLAFVLFFAQNSFSQERIYENASGSPLLSLIQKAKKTIEIEIYEMNNPSVLNSLLKAQQQGVKVRIVKEDKPVGASCRVFEAMNEKDKPSCITQKQFVLNLKQAGGQVLPFVGEVHCGKANNKCFQHGKLLIVDSKIAMLSTGNFNSTSLCDQSEAIDNCNRDYSITTEDKTVISLLEKIFNQDAQATPYDLEGLLKAAQVEKLTVSPYSRKPLVDLIRSARKTLSIQNQYLHDLDLNSEIMAAASRGVKVNIMVASACSFGRPKQNDIDKWNKIYGGFDALGINTRIFTRKIKISGLNGYLHSKAMIVDGVKAWVGSVNGSTTSLDDNREFGLMVSDLNEVRKLRLQMESDFNEQASETWQESLECRKDVMPWPPGSIPPVLE